jgi:hypothetical protein
MGYLPPSITSFFLFTAFVTLLAFAAAVRNSKLAIILTLLWIVLQSTVALSGFYLATNSVPPRFFAAVAPPIIVIIALSFTTSGRRFLERMELKWCVLFHTIRILVELNLYWLFLYKQVPALMTFEAGNVDILVGISAPLIWWLYRSGKIARTGLLIWNSLALLSVLNALVRAMLSAPFRWQRFAFDQPTVAILHFPFVLLPAFIVPAAILCHLGVFKKLSVATAVRAR